MPLVRTALLAAAASMLAAAAFADPVPAPMSPVPDASAPPMTDMSAPPATPDASAPTGAASDTSATVDANGVLMHSSAPIPDTPANRAAYGQPLSRTGKLTAPIGN